jgi:hypothetical protein
MQNKLPSILLGGLAVGLITTVLSIFSQPGSGNQAMGMAMGCVVCLAYVGAGLIAVWHYTNTQRLTLPAGEGVLMGLMAGAVAALVGVVLGLLLRAVGILPGPEEVWAQLEASGQFDDVPPESLEMSRNVMEMMMGPAGHAIALVLGAVAGLVGGAIGAAMFKKGGDRPA